MSDEKIDAVVGGPNLGIPGSKRYDCVSCGMPVWASPATQAWITAGARVLCYPCCRLETRDKPDAWFGITPEVWREYVLYKRSN